MLHKSKISKIKIHSDEWHASRLGKFTSSEIYRLMGSAESFIRYVREKVGEELTGKSAKQEVDTDATRWGLFHEADALTKFGQKKGLDFLIAQQLITEDGSRFGSTPDGLVVLRISPDDTEYEVEPTEVKCPPTFANYIGLYQCNSAADIKKEESKYYWQVLDQLDNCQSLAANFVVYHPDFRVGNLKIIRIEANEPFVDSKGKKTFPLYEDLKLLREKKKQAVEMFDIIRQELMSGGYI